ncbi:MAG: YigZ family protein [Mizugakiibacter sp.]|uniref:IMPACT family protein n=1 Tax=Mizugakiibacter sp. TaxID=1972610 RepID=UPI0031BF5BBC|nr:IMPACT family protein [Xanthomonadaceae bacterium]
MAECDAAPQTLAAACEFAQDVRKSRFLARAAPVADPAEALAFVERAADRGATHNCWAYRIGAQYRFSDDGEPGGTAGRPILQAIEGQGLDRVAVVVTRWFGGIKLGAGGLARAYGGCAAECLRRAPKVPLIALARFALACPFAELALLKSRLRELDAQIESESFGAEGAELTLALPERRTEALQRLLADLSRGRAAARRLDAAVD